MGVIAILDATIATVEGTYKLRHLTTQEAITLARTNEIQSFVGGIGACELLTDLIGETIQFVTLEYIQPIGGTALCFRLEDLPYQPLRNLTRQEIEDIGYEFALLTRIR